MTRPRIAAVSSMFLVSALACAYFSKAILAADKNSAAKTQVEHVFNTQPRDDKAAAAAFAQMVPVLRNPRCMNCHSVGDFPRQGDDGHPHAMNVRRGPEGHGVTAQKCGTCHQEQNTAGLHTPPGAPGWALPPPSTPMIWQGRSDAQVCEQIKDPKRNNHKSMDEIVHHMTKDELVGWGWHPGEGRHGIPIPREQFAKYVEEWAAKGGACPP
jgi:hypothetical protein